MNLENYSESQLPSLVHKAILIGQCIREIDAHWPEINSTTQRTIVAYSFIIVSEMVSCADYSIFQECSQELITVIDIQISARKSSKGSR